MNGSAPSAPTVAGGLIVVLLHRMLAHLSVRWHRLGVLLKGTADLVMEEGKPLLEQHVRSRPD